MSGYTWRELERAGMDTAAAHAAEMEHRSDLDSGRMSEHYEIDGYEVVFSPWHSEYLAEDFMGVSVRCDGCEVFHAGMTKLAPSMEQAREIIETMTMLEEALKVVSE